jgi:hypothetical protein
MEAERNPESWKGRQGRSGHFRIYFLGFHQKPPGVIANPADPIHAPVWRSPATGDEKAYFRADISWINLAADGLPRTSVLTAMITGDVRGLRKQLPGDPAPAEEMPESLPLSLGTYALSAEANAISIGNFRIDRGTPPLPSGTREPSLAPGPVEGAPERIWAGAKGRACQVDLDLSKPTRSKTIFLTLASAGALADLDQGLGRGVFPIESGFGADGEPGCIMYFGIDRL